MYNKNYKTLPKEIKDINKWKHIPCSWTRRLNIIKMSNFSHKFKRKKYFQIYFSKPDKDTTREENNRNIPILPKESYRLNAIPNKNSNNIFHRITKAHPKIHIVSSRDSEQPRPP